MKQYSKPELLRSLKFIVIIISSIILGIPCSGQDSTILKSKIEQFYDQPGILFKTETKEIAKIGDVKISLMKATNFLNEKSMSGIMLIQMKMFMLSPINYGGIIIDSDELEEISKNLSFYQSQIKKGKPDNEVYFYYLTRSDIRVSCTYTKALGWSVVIGKIYHFTGGFTPMGVLILKNKDVDDITDAIIKAKTEAF